MALRTIRVQGDPVLEKICKPVKELTPRTRELIEDMLDTMYEANGVGLAAPVHDSISQNAETGADQYNTHLQYVLNDF